MNHTKYYAGKNPGNDPPRYPSSRSFQSSKINSTASPLPDSRNRTHNSPEVNLSSRQRARIYNDSLNTDYRRRIQRVRRVFKGLLGSQTIGSKR